MEVLKALGLVEGILGSKVAINRLLRLMRYFQ